jgi:hypothetical protein
MSPQRIDVLHCQLAGVEQSPSPLRRIRVFLMVKSEQSHVILRNVFQHQEASSPRIYSDWLDPSGPDLWWQKLLRTQILALNPTNKFFKTPRHTRIFRAQLINRDLNKRLNIRKILGSCNILLKCYTNIMVVYNCQEYTPVYNCTHILCIAMHVVGWRNLRKLTYLFLIFYG